MGVLGLMGFLHSDHRTRPAYQRGQPYISTVLTVHPSIPDYDRDCKLLAIGSNPGEASVASEPYPLPTTFVGPLGLGDDLWISIWNTLNTG